MISGDHPAASLRDQRRIPDELDRVADALLGLEEDRASFKWRSIPHWLGKARPHRCERRRRQPRFGEFPTFFELALAQEIESINHPPFRIRRADRDCPT